MNPASAVVLIALAGFAAGAAAQTGLELIQESLRRHALPAHVFEEQALVLTDRQDQITVRTLRYYALRDDSGSRNLRVIETPTDLKGAALYVARDARGAGRHGAVASSPVFGSSFLVADLEGEQVEDFRYERDGDHDLERVPHYVLRAIPAASSVSRVAGYQERRIYLRKDNLFISRIDYRDRDGRVARRQTFRDPHPDESGAWRPGMILMEDLRDGGRALLKIERTVHSPDYVSADVFAGMSSAP